MWRNVSEWWNGTWIDDPPGSDVVIIARCYHWTAIWAHAVVNYMREHHRWIIGVSAGMAVAIITKLK
jgi:hypothetical protein